MFSSDRGRGSVSKHLYLYFAVLTCTETYLSGDRRRDRLNIGISDVCTAVPG